MEDLLGYAVAFAVIYAAYKYLSAGPATAAGSGQSPATVLGFAPKRVTPDMVTQVQAMFPDIPHDNIKYELLRNGSVELTCNKILEHGFLPPPPQQYYTLYPTQPLPNPTPNAPRLAGAGARATSKPTQTLIEKFNLKDKLNDPSISLDDLTNGGKGTWETTAAAREASLKERKAKMVLAARQRLLAQKQKESGETPTP